MRKVRVCREDIVDPRSGELVAVAGSEISLRQFALINLLAGELQAATGHEPRIEEFWSCCNEALVGLDHCPHCGQVVGATQLWTAILLNSESIITVLADSAEAARVRIREQLDRPGRDLYLLRWQQDGELVKERDNAS